MELYYKKFLEKQIKNFGIELCQNEIYRYNEELGFAGGDVYQMWYNIKYAETKQNCGVGIDDRARYYVLMRDIPGDVWTNHLYWFRTPQDAILFAEPEAGNMIGDAGHNAFLRYRQQGHKQVYFMLPEDLDDIVSIQQMQSGYICLDNNLNFDTREDIELWLVNSGRAGNLNNARRQLSKHLSGETSSCYKLRFEKI